MLPPFFDELSASDALDKVSIIRTQGAGQSNGLYGHLIDVDLARYSVAMFDEPKSWRLALRNEQTGSMEPVLFRIQGIIVDCMLPPIAKPSSNAERMRLHLRQGVSIAGLQSQSFEKVIDQIERIQVMLSNERPPESVEQWRPNVTQNGQPIISVHNRYFTRTVVAPNQPRVPFESSVDPDGYLSSLQDQRFAHMDDNRVEYYGQTLGNYVSPNTFRPGDIVEVSVEFCLYPSVKGSTPVIQLKAIRMLNSEFKNSAAILAMRSRYTNTVTIARVPKRRNMYEDEEMEGTRDKLQRMAVSEADRQP